MLQFSRKTNTLGTVPNVKIQSVQDAVVIDRCGDVVGIPLELVGRIAHCHADARLPDHGEVVAAVAERDGAAHVKPLVPCDSQDSLALIGLI